MAVATATKQDSDLMSKQEIMLRALFYPDAITAELCRRSFYNFMQEFWPEITQEEPKWNWHIEYICKELTKLAERVAFGLPKEYDLIINIPPGMTKSITCTIMFPVWCWIRWPWMQFIATSYSGPLSLEHAEYSRELVRSNKFQRVFPELQIKADKDQKGNFVIQETIFNSDGTVAEVKRGGNRFSTSVGGSLTGFHGHILIVDDPLNPEKAVSEVELEKANRFMSQTLSTRKIDKAITPTILIMQRLHQSDPAGRILDLKKDKTRLICLPGESWNYGHKIHPPELIQNYENGLLDPVRLSADVLKEMEEDLGQYGYAGQVGQDPTPPKGGMFKVDRFEIIDQMPSDAAVLKTLRYWDKAGTAGGGAFSVGVKWHALQNRKLLISDVKRGQWSSETREEIIKSRAEADGHKCAVFVEQEPGSGGKESAEGTIRNLAGFRVYADVVSGQGSKVFRADPYSVQVNNGNVLLLRGEWNQAFIDEHRFFPYGTYKDQVDAASGGFAKIVGKKKARAIGGRRRR